ncbi:MAG TPA: tRNA (N6-isopentenyl adenosine(37)-C2)-methylthiotransferase MiaB [Verrucomicrobiae bacterium]|jgi:tRNA-2-methylthio-N6-dimethylallyladenosine synthase|nr:tRNA (N6-isopentenyl adenosine(37)-C2)-methylthiotransferase MiaB [Verrucomicrobiae bacterium]
MSEQKLKVSIKTFGCQMNMYDSEVAGGLLSAKGFEIIPEEWERSGDGRKLLPAADVVLMNTCSVREHAEDRVYGRLGMLGKAKETNPELIVGLMGCMVEEHKEKLFRRFPQLDLMVGTRNIADLPALVEEVRRTRRQVSKIKQDGVSIEYTDQIQRQGHHHAWLPIMTGCNKVCTFCIVPITRGSEVSMPAREVYREAGRLAGEGVKWITLLGQNVNSYTGSGRDADAKQTGFPELLEMLCEIPGVERISFTTSHPHDATPELYRVIARNPKLSRRFHLPLQSGSDRMLKRMKRLHTYAEYLEKIRAMRAMIPDVSVTTDIIAGFSGETPEDHEATMRALEEIRYDGAYIYKYSVRPGTPAAKLEDDVPLETKETRNQELLQLQKKITEESNRQWLGRELEVFAEAPGAKDAAQLTGRSHQEKKVVFEGPRELLGSFVKVRVVGLAHDTLIAERL